MMMTMDIMMTVMLVNIMLMMTMMMMMMTAWDAGSHKEQLTYLNFI